MWWNTCLSLSCNSILLYNVIYLPKVFHRLLKFLIFCLYRIQWAMFMGINAKYPAKSITSIKNINKVYKVDIWRIKSACWWKAKLVLIFEGPTFNLCYSNCIFATQTRHGPRLSFWCYSWIGGRQCYPTQAAPTCLEWQQRPKGA